MRCPVCHCLEDKVIDSRSTKDGAGVRRRRECLKCAYRFTTAEEIIQNELKIVKRDELREDFSHEKLASGVYNACWKRPIDSEKIDLLINNIYNSIQNDFDKEVPSTVVGERVMEGLKKLDQVAYVRFASVYRQFTDIDEFIDEIKALGRRPKKLINKKAVKND